MASTTPPMEIVTDILLRLPIKDILRSKCVAKAWNNLIASPHFVKRHLHRTPHHASESDRRLILIGPDSLQVVDFGSLNLIHKLDYPPGLAPGCFLIGSCNGLICVSNRPTFPIALINPATRTSRLVTWTEAPPHTRASCFGFGYDSRTDDYKVIMVSSSLADRRGSPAFKRGIRIYSLRTNSWRLFSEEPSDEEIGSRGAVASGKMHWVAIMPGREGKCRILSFDIEQESLGEVLMPPYYGEQVHHPKAVAELAGNLCFLTEANRTGIIFYIDVWVMKEYGNEHSWNKMYSVWCWVHPYPVFSSTSGNQVLYCKNGALYWYNRYEQKEDMAQVRGAEQFSEAIISVGSLVPVL